MSNSGEQPTIGETLYAKGWRQGSLFCSSSLCFTLNDIDEGGSPSILGTEKDIEADCFLIITQECDLVSAGEGHVEALPVRSDPKKATGVLPGSGRWFVLSREQGLVADGRYRIAISKEALLMLEPKDWPWSSDALRRFRFWLGHRYTRPAFHDHVVKAFQEPVRKALQDALRKKSPAVQTFNEIVAPLMVRHGSVDRSPLEIRLLVVATCDSLTEEQERAIKETLVIIESALDPQAVRLEHVVRTGPELSIAEYFSHDPMELERLSFKGEDLVGAEGYGSGRAAVDEVLGKPEDDNQRLST